MTPTKKILYQNEKDFQNSFHDKQMIQLQASVQINEVKLFQNDLIDTH